MVADALSRRHDGEDTSFLTPTMILDPKLELLE